MWFRGGGGRVSGGACQYRHVVKLGGQSGHVFSLDLLQLPPQV